MMSSSSSNGKHINEFIIFFSPDFFVNFDYNELKPFIALVALINNYFTEQCKGV